MLTRQAVLSDYEELLAFENGVFDVDFLNIVPKLYSDPARCAACHGIIRDGESITAAIAAWPTAMETDCGTLRAVGVGSVAVGAQTRGKGYMKELMAFFEKSAEAHRADFAFLSGSRGRYEHYGFYPCGSRVLFEVTPYFVRHFSGRENYVFIPLAEDAEGLRSARALHDGLPLRWARSQEEYLVFLRTWGAQCFSVRNGSGAFCGCLVFEERRACVSELLLCDPAQAAAVLAAFSKKTGCETMTVAAEPTQTALLSALCVFGEHITVEMPAAFKVYHWRRVLEVLGSHKAKHFALPEGSLVLQIEDEVLRVTVQNGKCTATPTDEEPALCFTSKEAAVNLTTTFGQYVPHSLFAAWAPLCPLGLPHADNV